MPYYTESLAITLRWLQQTAIRAENKHGKAKRMFYLPNLVQYTFLNTHWTTVFWKNTINPESTILVHLNSVKAKAMRETPRLSLYYNEDCRRRRRERRRVGEGGRGRVGKGVAILLQGWNVTPSNMTVQFRNRYAVYFYPLWKIYAEFQTSNPFFRYLNYIYIFFHWKCRFLGYFKIYFF